MPRKPNENDPGGFEEDESAALSDLSSLAADLGRAAADSEEEQRTADAIFERISRLSRDAQKRLFSREPVQRLFLAAADKDAPGSRDDPPGTIYYRTINGEKTPWGKKPWTWGDLWNPPPPRTPMPLKTWEPAMRMTLQWQGLIVTVHAHQEVTLPEVFYGEYRESIRNARLGKEHAEWLMKKRATLTDPSIVTINGAMSRAVANHDGAVNVCGLGQGFPSLEHVGNDLDAERAAG